MFKEQVDAGLRASGVAEEDLAARRAGGAGQGRGVDGAGQMIIGTLLYQLLTSQEITMGFVQDLFDMVLTGIEPPAEVVTDQAVGVPSP